MMTGAISGSYAAAYDPYAVSDRSGMVRRKGDGAESGVCAQNGLEGAGQSDRVKGGYKSSPADCQTCKERKYQDGSNEADVSFKAPGHISPESSASTVMAHEKQHVSNAYQKAAEKQGQVVSCRVSLQTAICPECGTAYVSGGTTSTSISYPDESNPYQKNKKAQDAIRLTGANIDYAA